MAYKLNSFIVNGNHYPVQSGGSEFSPKPPLILATNDCIVDAGYANGDLYLISPSINNIKFNTQYNFSKMTIITTGVGGSDGNNSMLKQDYTLSNVDYNYSHIGTWSNVPSQDINMNYWSNLSIDTLISKNGAGFLWDTCSNLNTNIRATTTSITYLNASIENSHDCLITNFFSNTAITNVNINNSNNIFIDYFDPYGSLINRINWSVYQSNISINQYYVNFPKYSGNRYTPNISIHAGNTSQGKQQLSSTININNLWLKPPTDQNNSNRSISISAWNNSNIYINSIGRGANKIPPVSLSNSGYSGSNSGNVYLNYLLKPSSDYIQLTGNVRTFSKTLATGIKSNLNSSFYTWTEYSDHYYGTNSTIGLYLNIFWD